MERSRDFRGRKVGTELTVDCRVNARRKGEASVLALGCSKEIENKNKQINEV